MSTVRAVLERLNDLEATITQVERDVVAKRSFATQLSLQSLENRRDELREELESLSSREFVDICDYKIVPGSTESYAMSAITGALHDFQELLSLVFGAVEANQPRMTAKLSRDVIEKTQLNFGYAYAGSLGIVMTIRNDRLLLGESTLDKSIAIVFESLEAKTPERIKAIATTYGVPVVKRLYHMAKTHSQFDMNAEIKWVRDRSIKKRVLTQAPEFAKICRIIEDKSDTTTEDVTVTGTLLAWNVQTKAFLLDFPEGEQISGRWADDFEAGPQRKVPARYMAVLTKKTTVKYAEEKDQVVWLLHSLTEMGS